MSTTLRTPFITPLSTPVRTPLPAPPHLPSLVRLRLSPAGGGPHRIDGVWWPRTGDLLAELPLLLGALPHSWPQIAHVTVNSAIWSDFPGRTLIANHVLQLNRSPSRHTPSTVCLLAPGRGRWDLLVVPPHTDAADALRLMAGAVTP